MGSPQTQTPGDVRLAQEVKRGAGPAALCVKPPRFPQLHLLKDVVTFGAQWENVRTSLEIELYLFICVSACLAQDLPQPSFYKTFKVIRLFTWKTSCSFFTPRMRCVLGVRRAGCWAGLLSLRLRHFARRRCIPRDKSWWVQTPCPGLCSYPTSPRLLALERGEAFSQNHRPACGRPPAAGGGSRGSGAASGPVWCAPRPRRLGHSQPSPCAPEPKAWGEAGAQQLAGCGRCPGPTTMSPGVLGGEQQRLVASQGGHWTPFRQIDQT